jgi:uncharacterized membrane protein HdeD (DUF308 family)
MLEQVIRHWWVLALRGVLAIVFAAIAFSQPGITLHALVWVWGAYAIVDGVLSLVLSGRAAEDRQPWGMLLLGGIAGIAAGIIAFVWPGITALALIYLIAGWAIVTGLLEIAAAIALAPILEGEWLLGLSGVLSVLLGALIMARPGAGLIAWVWMIGVYALLYGVFMLALGFRVRALGQPSAASRPAAT